MKQIEITDFAKNKNRVYANHNHRRTSPVINDRGDFYISASEASRALGVGLTIISGVIDRKTEYLGRKWRFATLDECLSKGYVLTGVAAAKVKEMNETAKKTEKQEKRKVETVDLRSATSPTLLPPTAEEGSKKGSKPATFYGVKWPDGAITIRANHGSTWSMTRTSSADIPAEMLNEVTWVNQNQKSA